MSLRILAIFFVQCRARSQRRLKVLRIYFLFPEELTTIRTANILKLHYELFLCIANESKSPLAGVLLPTSKETSFKNINLKIMYKILNISDTLFVKLMSKTSQIIVIE